MTNRETRGGHEGGGLPSPEEETDGLEGITPQQAVEELRVEPKKEGDTWRKKIRKNPLIKKLMLAGAASLTIAGGSFEIGRQYADKEEEASQYKRLEDVERFLKAFAQAAGKFVHVSEQRLHDYDDTAYEKMRDDANNSLLGLLHAAHQVLVDPNSTVQETRIASKIISSAYESWLVIPRYHEMIAGDRLKASQDSQALITEGFVKKSLRTLKLGGEINIKLVNYWEFLVDVEKAFEEEDKNADK